MEDDDQPDETTRLLNQPATEPPRLSPLRAIVAAFTIHLLLTIGSNLALAPQTAIIQDIVCSQYYDGVSSRNNSLPTDKWCGVAPVQSEVAYVIGWEAAIENIPNMLFAVPFGALADRVGRKKILLLAVCGMFMNDAWIRLVLLFPDVFPVRAIWGAGLWQSIGAGAATFSSLTHALVADACPEEQRTSAFSQIRSAKLLAQLLFVSLGGALIQVNPWLPMWISTAFTTAGLVAAMMLVPNNWATHTSGESRPLLDEDDESRDSKRAIMAKLFALASWTSANARLLPLVLSFFVFQLGEQAGMTLLLQYAAKRLSWSLGQASALISIRAGVNLAALVVLVPAISAVLLKRMHLSALKTDKRIAQGSGALLVIGCVVVALAVSPTVLIMGLVLISLGDVFNVPVRSLATGLVDPSHLAVLYTVIEVMTQSGLFIGQPMLAAMFRWGLELGVAWLGLPFLFAAVFFMFALAAVSFVPSRRANAEH